MKRTDKTLTDLEIAEIEEWLENANGSYRDRVIAALLDHRKLERDAQSGDLLREGLRIARMAWHLMILILIFGAITIGVGAVRACSHDCPVPIITPERP